MIIAAMLGQFARGVKALRIAPGNGAGRRRSSVEGADVLVGHVRTVTLSLPPFVPLNHRESVVANTARTQNEKQGILSRRDDSFAERKRVTGENMGMAVLLVAPTSEDPLLVGVAMVHELQRYVDVLLLHHEAVDPREVGDGFGGRGESRPALLAVRGERTAVAGSAPNVGVMQASIEEKTPSPLARQQIAHALLHNETDRRLGLFDAGVHVMFVN